MPQSSLFARPDAPWTGRQAFEGLLCSLYSDTDLRRWLTLAPNIGELVPRAKRPSLTASPASKRSAPAPTARRSPTACNQMHRTKP